MTAVEDVTSGSLAPVDGEASFVVDADEMGNVTAVRVADVSSDEAAWREVAGLLLAKMKGHPLHVRPGWRGISVSLHVRSRLQLADGVSRARSAPARGEVGAGPVEGGARRGTFDVTELSGKEYRRIDAWESEERPR